MDMLSLKNHFGDCIKENISLKNLNWFKTGGTAKYLFIPQNLADLKFFLANKPKDIKIFILGAGSNVLINDKNLDLCVIKLTNFNSLYLENDEVIAEAGVLNSSLANFALNNNLGNFEFLSGIPGSIGGGVAMNAGAFGGEFKDIISKILALDYDGNMLEFSNEAMGFGYRKNSLSNAVIFYQAHFKAIGDDKKNIQEKLDFIKQNREENQPKKVFTGGSTFANPLPHKAWELIDKVGLRGYKIGGALFSTKHCNFIINEGNATFEDILKLILEAKKRVKEQCNIDMHTEIKIIE